jgi:tetratricopeptide (TPR) repeat protein
MVLPFQVFGARAAAPAPHLLFTEALSWIPGVRGIDGTSLGPTAGPAAPLGDLLQGARRAGAKYLVTGAILGGGAKVSVDLYSTGTGERIAHNDDTATGPRLDGAIGRLAFESLKAFARQEGLDLGGRRAVLASTSSIAAAGHLLRGQTKFWQDDYAAAADEFRAAVAADSGCGLAYQRLGRAETWQINYPAALAALDAGLARRDRLASRWVNLLRAQRYYVLGLGDSAIAVFQGTVLDDPTEVDGWLGLGKSLSHFAGFTGHSTMDARSALERVVSLDSTFAPIYDDLAQLAVYAGDERAARTYLARLLPDSPVRAGTAAIVSLRFGSPEERVAALAQLRSADRHVLREAIIFWMHGGYDLGLADSAAGYLMGSDRTPDDRRRGAQYRLIALTGQGRLPEALRAWSSTAGAYPFDPWMVQAYLAGYPVREVAEPMFAWARAQLAQGGTLDFNRPAWDEVRQGFEALVHRASLEGDSAEVLDLLRRIKGAPSPDPTEPSPDALRASLEGRLSLLAGDTVAAIGALRRSVSRIAEIYTANHPLMTMAPQRLLLSELAATRGDSVEAGRWRDSFSNSWSIADVLYLARLGRVRPRPLIRRMDSELSAVGFEVCRPTICSGGSNAKRSGQVAEDHRLCDEQSPPRADAQVGIGGRRSGRAVFHARHLLLRPLAKAEIHLPCTTGILSGQGDAAAPGPGVRTDNPGRRVLHQSEADDHYLEGDGVSSRGSDVTPPPGVIGRRLPDAPTGRRLPAPLVGKGVVARRAPPPPVHARIPRSNSPALDDHLSRDAPARTTPRPAGADRGVTGYTA